MSEERARQLARLHSVLGIVPLAVFLVVHLTRAFSAFDGRAAWIEAMVEPALGTALRALLMLSLVAHAALGVWRWRGRPQHADALGGRRLARVQLVTGVLATAFIAYHTLQVWPAPAGAHADPGRSYDLLHEVLGMKLHLVAYVLGITALCAHVGHGLSRLPFTWGALPDVRYVLRARLVGGAAGLVLWLLALHVVGYFATGDGLWPRTRSAPTVLVE